MLALYGIKSDKKTFLCFHQKNVELSQSQIYEDKFLKNQRIFFYETHEYENEHCVLSPDII